ncbi:MAG: IS1595 family transposase [Syntrophobacterales bacterium]|nr:IS1595 family transposase [Syntrophobacterales bacterium]
MHIPYRDWLRVVRYFEQELSPHKIAQQVGLSYPTVHKAVTVLRRAIVAQQGELLVREGEAPEAYGGRKPQARGREAAGKVEVFGILERDGLVQVEGLRNLRAEMVLNLAVKKVRCGSIVYTDRYDIYDSLMFYGYRQDQKKIIASGKVYIDRIEGFWSFAKERLIKHHGVSKDKFPLYLKEMEFRYNHRKEPLFPLLCQYLARLIPGRY